MVKALGSVLATNTNTERERERKRIQIERLYFTIT
jgi:hypothetical protein